VGFEGSHDVHDFLLEIRRIGELLFGVVGGLLFEGFGFEQFALDDVVDVDQFVLLGEVVFE